MRDESAPDDVELARLEAELRYLANQPEWIYSGFPEDQDFVVGSDDLGWLEEKMALLEVSAGGSGMLMECIISALQTGSDNIANELLELVGLDHIDLVSDLISRRNSLIDSWERRLIDKAAASHASAPGQRVQVRLKSEMEAQKQGEKLARKRGIVLGGISTQKQMAGASSLSDDELRRVLSGDQQMAVILPGVFKSSGASASLASFGAKLALPAGTEREDSLVYESFKLPYQALGRNMKAETIEIVPIDSLDGFSKKAFPGYKALSRMQSAVFHVAHESQENMLVCAPTGAGKTDVAMLTVLRCLLDHQDARKDSFKIVYVAPMKALAAEVAAKFGNRLKPFGIAVREYTGDMQLTRAEVAATQMLVTTPEKWDVVTRKGSGDVALVEAVRLLILDEIHLLQDDRGPVIEALVSRTLRSVELSQRPVRIVGLSATLPNYLDVALFLRVNLQAGLFYFDEAFRPVPLTQTLIGIKSRSEKQYRESLEKTCYQRAVEFLRAGHQVMVFVHARNDTVTTGRNLLRLAKEDAAQALFLPSDEHCKTEAYMRFSVDAARNCRSRELQDFFRSGLAIHHAGLPRSDRNMVEAAFGAGHVRLLVCTATLAWGVNLPAHAVIIKGTQMWNPAQGGPVRLGVLDVLQIFGRAGRPQYETHGEAILLTRQADLAHYLSALLSQTPIESRLGARLPDALNAEVSLGTVSSIGEAVRWLGYSYLRIRMSRNPTAYGLTPKQLAADPTLEAELSRIATEAARVLRDAGMVGFDETSGRITSRDVGRIASLFYLTHGTASRFGQVLGSLSCSEETVLGAVSSSDEFEQLRVRQEELDELEVLMNSLPLAMPKGLDRTGSSGKAYTLISAWISRASVDAFSLASDLNYVGQNGGRLLRAAWEMARSQGWARAARACLSLAVAFERRVWMSAASPLCQVIMDEGVKLAKSKQLPPDIMSALLYSRRLMDPAEVRPMKPAAIKEALKVRASAANDAQNNWDRIREAAYILPTFRLENIRGYALSSAGYRLSAEIKVDAHWDERYHQASQRLHIWLESSDGEQMISRESCTELTLHRANLSEAHLVEFFLPESLSTGRVFLRIVSDHWNLPQALFEMPKLKPAKEEPLEDMPTEPPSDHVLSLLRVLNLDVDALNPIQKAALSLIETGGLIAAPSGSGLGTILDLVLLRHSKVTLISPLSLEPLLESAVSLGLDKAIIRSYTPGSVGDLDDVVVLLDLDLFSLEYELGLARNLARLRRVPLRFAFFSDSFQNAHNFAQWLQIKSVLSFPPIARPTPLTAQLQGFPARSHTARLASMHKPVYTAACKEPGKTLIWCPSRKQAALTAQALIAMTSNDDQPTRFVGSAVELSLISSPVLKHCLSFGIGILHEGVSVEVRKQLIAMFVQGNIRVLLASLECVLDPCLAGLSADQVILQGTNVQKASEFAPFIEAPAPIVQRALAYARTSVIIMTQQGQRSFYKHLLCEAPFIESFIPDAEAVAELLASLNMEQIEEAVRVLREDTLLGARLKSNPRAYGCEGESQVERDEWLWGLAHSALELAKTVPCRIPRFCLASSKILGDLEDGISPQMLLQLIALAVHTELQFRCTASIVIQVQNAREEEEIASFIAHSSSLKPVLQWAQLVKGTTHVKSLILLLAHIGKVERLPLASWKPEIDRSVTLARQALEHLLTEVQDLQRAESILHLLFALRLQELPKPLTVSHYKDISARITGSSLRLAQTTRVFVSAAAAKTSAPQSSDTLEGAYVLPCVGRRLVMRPAPYTLIASYALSKPPDKVLLLTPDGRQLQLPISS